MPPLRIAVLLSGAGTSLENLLVQIEAGRLDAQVVAVIASKSRAGGLERAARRGIPARAIPRRDYPDVEAFNARCTRTGRHAADLVLLGSLSPPPQNARPLSTPPDPFASGWLLRHHVHEAVIESA